MKKRLRNLKGKWKKIKKKIQAIKGKSERN